MLPGVNGELIEPGDTGRAGAASEHAARRRRRCARATVPPAASTSSRGSRWTRWCGGTWRSTGNARDEDARPSRRRRRGLLRRVAAALPGGAADRAWTTRAAAAIVVVPYRPDAVNYVRPEDWDEVAYAPWPRFDPLPGAFGRHRRLLANLDAVARAVGPCRVLHLHSPVYDTEAVNYFVGALPGRCGAQRVHARIVPDGLLNISRNPLSAWRRAAQHVRALRRLVSPELRYTRFGGDRIGADAPFVDRIYTLAGFPHPYLEHKVVELAPLVSRSVTGEGRAALVVGQPLVGIGLMSQADHDAVTARISDWLARRGIREVVYKAHPRDPRQEFRPAGSTELTLDVPLEMHLSRHAYEAVVGINSTALFMAGQICGPRLPVVAFGSDRVRFPDAAKRDAVLSLLDRLHIEQL
ncbi:MAG: alpha-2,8-polysialyltransferase family protein [Comamonadaceae bacterium]|nr:alpha-2,8-polysialyltransferase family protein [Comamonadaceae bacterium]